MNETHPNDRHEQLGHVVPASVLVGVFAALLVLTVVTVAVSRVDVGSLNLWVALAVATAKASLVVLYFMHLRYDSPFNAIIFACALLFLGLFLGIVMLDAVEYQPGIQTFLQDSA